MPLRPQLSPDSSDRPRGGPEFLPDELRICRSEVRILWAPADPAGEFAPVVEEPYVWVWETLAAPPAPAEWGEAQPRARASLAP